MFTHTKEGRVNDLLRHNRDRHICTRLCSLLCVYFDNQHLCHALYARNIGTNIYHCDRLLLFTFHILLIAALSLLLILCYQQAVISSDIASNNEFIWMFIICLITLCIIELLVRCIGLSTPNKLELETIELLLSIHTIYIQTQICIVIIYIYTEWKQKAKGSQN